MGEIDQKQKRLLIWMKRLLKNKQQLHCLKKTKETHNDTTDI